MRVAALVVNYNMPERADALAEAIKKSVCPVDCILIDNGSDIVAPARHTEFMLEKNVQTTNGWLAGVRYANGMYPYDAYMFIITSAEFVFGDVVAECAHVLETNPKAAGVHAALTEDSTTMWEHMKKPGKTWFIDNIASMWRSDFFMAHPFDPALTYGHGIDLELCYNARKEGREIWITDAARVRKVTDIGYTMNRMNMSAEDRRRNAFANMTAVLSKRYGPDYWNILTKSYGGQG